MTLDLPPPADSDTPPDWVLTLLETVREGGIPAPFPGQETFLQDCRRAAGTARTLALLRRERQRVGFVPLPLREYVQGLAEGLKLSLAGTLAWAGLDDGAWTALGLARLARGLGMSLRETVAHVRIAFARDRDAMAQSLLLARRRAGEERSPLDEVEFALGQIEARYDRKNLVELRKFEAAIRAAYQMTSDETA